MTMIGEAIALAAEVHKDQTDKLDEPYIWHPLEVCRRATEYYLTRSEGWQLEFVQAAAVLHDVREDYEAPYSFSRKRLDAVLEDRFPRPVVVAVHNLTKQVVRWESDGEGNDKPIFESYMDSYIPRVSMDWIARIVKIADLSHNLDAFRMPPGAGEVDFKRWDKYHRAMVYLTQTERREP